MKTKNCKIRNKLPGVSSLVDLCAMLNKSEDRCRNCDEHDHCEYVDGNDLTSLPTFGGPDIPGTDGIFSWDEKNVLVPTNDGQWEIISRDELP